MKWKEEFLSLFVSVILAFVCCAVLSLIVGENPLTVMKTLGTGAFGSLSNFGYTLFYATPLIFTGLAVAVAFHGGLFNIGAEGQLYMGSLTLATAGILFPSAPIAKVFGVLAACLGGMLWGGLAGFLKSVRGCHEVIVTIMLNFISYFFCSFAILHLIKNPLTPNPESAEVSSRYYLPGLGEISTVSPVNSTFVIALVVAFLIWVLLFKTTWGFRLRMVGSNPQTAERAGISAKRMIIEAMALSGALASVVAVNEIMGFVHKFRDQYSTGYGFMGIAVALLGRNRPFGIVVSAILFGALQKGALDLEFDTEKITRDLSGVIVALIILFVASRQYWGRIVRRHAV